MIANPLGIGLYAIVGLYLLTMVALSVAARRKQKQGSLNQFYLADRSLGPLVLMLTFYATQYSGNSLVGLPGETHRVGFLWILSLGYMTSVVVAYLLFAPNLYRASRTYGFVTPGDWIDHRFQSPTLTLFANFLFLLVMVNFLLAQLMAMGHVVTTASGHAVPFWAGVAGLGLVIVLYETVGGMRAVAWTDCVQGGLLMLGLAGIMIAVLPGLGGLHDTSAWIIEHAPEKAAVPEGAAIRTWISTLLLVGFSAAIYPQAIQRIFAAESARTLRNSLRAMAFLPLVTVLPMFLIGILSIPRLSGLDGVAADQVMPALLNAWAGETLYLRGMVIVVLVGAIAAIMSTADSVLLSLSSILAKDILGKVWLPDASSQQLARLGKVLSWAVLSGLIVFALSPRISLWGLIELKLEILIQISPLFILGTLWPGMTARGALAGLSVGTILSAALTLSGAGKVWGWHSGVIGVAANLIVALLVSMCLPANAASLTGHGASQRPNVDRCR
jgi:SSS family transporter